MALKNTPKLKHTTIMIIFLTVIPLYAGNPFLSGPDHSEKEKIKQSEKAFSNSTQSPQIKGQTNQKSIFLSNTILEELRLIQKKIHGVLTQQASKIKNSFSLGNMFLFFIFSFLYGIFHAAGPGHGKVVVFSYFLSRKAKPRSAILLGSMIGIIHAASAIILVIVLKWVIESAFSKMDSTGQYLQSISYALILGIAIYMIFDFIKDRMKKPTSSEHESANLEKKNMISIAIAVGLVPCPGVVLIMIFGFSLNIFFISLIASVFMAFGMAFTISFAGLITLGARKGLMHLAENSPQKFSFIHSSLSLLGIIFLLLFSIVMFLGSL